jgi:DNA-directed RNA polymerase specialized sigma subunit
MPVMEANDMDLLREYVRNHSEEAFRTLVERHVNMVHAVALRQTGQASGRGIATWTLRTRWTR